MKFWKKLPYGWKVCMAFILFFISTLSFAYFRGKHTVPNLGMESLEPNPEIVQSWEGKPRIVYFWANWCSVCKVYKPVLDANLSLIPKDTLFFSIREADEGEEAGRSKLESESDLYIADYNLLKEWEVGAYPTTVFVSGNGKILFSDTGIISPIGFFLRSFFIKFF